MKLTSTFFVLIGMAVGLAFQNCSNLNIGSQFSVAADLRSPLAINHPDVSPDITPTSSKPAIQLMDRRMMISHVRQLFIDSKTSADIVSWFGSIEFVDTTQFQTSMGGACNVLSTGNNRDCNYNFGNQNLPFYSSGSPSREAGRFLLCSRMTFHQVFLDAFLRRIPNVKATPDRASVAAAYALMHRGQEPPAAVLDALMNLDDEMIQAQEAPGNRWRLMVQTVCESSAWQVL
jgi:hypothetical protein